MKILKSMKNKGFTLVEVLVAVGILVMVLSVAILLEFQHLRLATYNSHRLQAENLAQGTMTKVGTVRDNNVFNDANNPFAGMGAGTYCLTQLSSGDKWSLMDAAVVANCPTTNTQVTLNNIVYIVTISIEQ